MGRSMTSGSRRVTVGPSGNHSSALDERRLRELIEVEEDQGASATAQSNEAGGRSAEGR